MFSSTLSPEETKEILKTCFEAEFRLDAMAPIDVIRIIEHEACTHEILTVILEFKSCDDDINWHKCAFLGGGTKVDSQHYSPVHALIYKSCPRCIAVALRHGVEFTRKTKYPITPLQLLMHGQNLAVEKPLHITQQQADEIKHVFREHNIPLMLGVMPELEGFDIFNLFTNYLPSDAQPLPDVEVKQHNQKDLLSWKLNQSMYGEEYIRSFPVRELSLPSGHSIEVHDMRDAEYQFVVHTTKNDSKFTKHGLGANFFMNEPGMHYSCSLVNKFTPPAVFEEHTKPIFPVHYVLEVSGYDFLAVRPTDVHSPVVTLGTGELVKKYHKRLQVEYGLISPKEAALKAYNPEVLLHQSYTISRKEYLEHIHAQSEATDVIVIPPYVLRSPMLTPRRLLSLTGTNDDGNNYDYNELVVGHREHPRFCLSIGSRQAPLKCRNDTRIKPYAIMVNEKWFSAFKRQRSSLDADAKMALDRLKTSTLPIVLVKTCTKNSMGYRSRVYALLYQYYLSMKELAHDYMSPDQCLKYKEQCIGLICAMNEIDDEYTAEVSFKKLSPQEKYFSKSLYADEPLRRIEAQERPQCYFLFRASSRRHGPQQDSTVKNDDDSRIIVRV